MPLKVLGGVAKGFSLAAPKTGHTRPTSVLIRRKLFDWRQQLAGFEFIDLCAGSGAVGFEAFSRGAEKIYLNDSFKLSLQTLKKNKMHMEKAFNCSLTKVAVTSFDAREWIDKELSYEMSQNPQLILFLDPPYEKHSLYFDVIAQLKVKKFKGEIWLESDKLKGPSMVDLKNKLVEIIKTVEHGDHFVVVGKLE